ncbi:hydrogenase maturation protein [Pseudothauera rhizosphaerae]|uniref:Hydrogenase maturation protein n=1 Tax=Pseudothauera rhizosphaerae TaxID=2565932 RepID=A0A4S4B357_9RHOO|nr:hydrogenase maturation protein [Pseudothauera rhizosphaerae]THF65341.1 hydrogenase maturation protein [Pseudothauera rhizosphaerae]
MRILLLTHAFNSLTQRLYAELAADGHELSVEFDIADSVTGEAVALFAPDLVLAPFLKRPVPESVWRRVPTLIVHPGIVGDRGPSALDHAVQQGLREWGVTVLQAEAEMDAGPVWAHAEFALRPGATKAGTYRNEVTAAALAAVRAALTHYPDWRAGRWQPRVQDYADPAVRGRPHAPMNQAERALDWAAMTSAEILARIRAADGFPGVLDSLFGQPCRLFDAHPGPRVAGAEPGTVIGRRHDALQVATRDGSVWIGHVQRPGHAHPFKLPAALAFADEAATLPERADATPAYPDIAYRESADGRIGYLAFEFYNGAMGSAQCGRLVAAVRAARRRPAKVLVLTGGHDFWSNGIHLGRIEAAASPADESWRNIQAMDDLCLALLETTDRLTVAALRGNAGAGGCFLALACDQVWARDGVVLNPHYKNMGNLYGSEYWTYLLPRRVGEAGAARLMGERLPLTARLAAERGLVDRVFGGDVAAFEAELERQAAALAAGDVDARIAAKAARRAADEAARPLAAYRAQELEMMRRNFYGFDPSYHVARYHFVMKTPHSWTPRHLARHREPGWRPAAEAAA